MSLRTPSTGLLPRSALLINGERRSSGSGGTHEHIYPATGRPTADVPLAGPEDMDAAVVAARDALPGWRALPINERRKLLLRLAALVRENAEELTELCILENGTARMFAQAYPELVADLFEYNAGWADKIGGEVVPTWPLPALDYTIEEPYGVVGIIIPWNAPFGSAGMTMAPALAAGNCVVVKPPELAPWSVLRLGELALEAGFPPGVINVLPAGPVGGDALVRHPQVDFIHFTGSGATAKIILRAAAETVKPVGLELGGKSPRLIFADADLSGAVAETVGNLVAVSGQGCIFGMRLLVHADVYSQVLDLLKAYTEAIALGDPFDASTQMGPVANEAAATRIAGMMQRASGEGARLITGGERADGELAAGYYIKPTVFADVRPGSELSRNEVFGPVVSVTSFESDEEAVALANDSELGLAGYVWTKDVHRALRIAGALEAGNVWINGFMGLPASAPFGGNKQSGFGRLGGREGIREFTRTKNVWLPLSPMQLPS